jgi:hypothetical protein
MWPQELNVCSVNLDPTCPALLKVLIAAKGCEAPVLRDNDLLATGELILGPPQSLDSGRTVCITCPHGQNDLTNVDTGDSSVRLTPSTTHTSLKSIGSSTRQHLVDTNNVEGVSTDSHVETILSSNFDKILVGANTGSFEGLRRKLFVLVRNQVDAKGEFVNTGTLASQIEDTNLGVGNTTVEA